MTDFETVPAGTMAELDRLRTDRDEYKAAMQKAIRASMRHIRKAKEATAELEVLREENEALRCHVQRLREVCEESQDWNWLSEKEAMEKSGRDFFSIDEMQELVDALDEPPPPSQKPQANAQELATMTDHMANANDYIDGYTDAYNGHAPRRNDDHYREGYEAGKQQAPQPAPFCAPGDDDCEACQ